MEKRIVGARGTHLMFKKGMLPEDSGIIIPKTKDGRLIYIINYLGHPMVGTTDEKCEVTHYCEPSKEEIDFICRELKPYFGEDYDFEANMMSAWAGIRPLVKAVADPEAHRKDDVGGVKAQLGSVFANSVRWLAFKVNSSNKKASSSAKMSRSHEIEISKSGLVSLMGGKWTSFRYMGEDTVNQMLKRFPDLS